MDLFILLFLLQAKHLIVDFLLQPPWMYQNKGKYGHPGGISHALFHGLFTFGLCMPLVHFSYEQDWLLLFYVALGESIFHYHVDWLKVNLCSRFKLFPTTSHKYWYALGVDQFLHQVSYIVVVYFMVNL